MGINRVVVSGNLTRESELRQTSTGMSVLKFGIAVNDKRKNSQTGEWEDYPNYLDCTLFGARADALSKYLLKGTKVAIEGKLRWSQWERDGQKRSKIEIIVDNLDFMSRSNNAQVNNGTAGSFDSSHSTYGTNDSASAATIDSDSSAYSEDIPF